MIILLRNVLALTFLYTTTFVFSQTNEVKQHFKTETDALNRLVKESTEFEPLLNRTQKAMAWAKRAHQDSMYWSFRFYNATAYKLMLKVDTAIAILKTIDSVAEARGYLKLQVRTQINLARILKMINDGHSESHKWLDKLRPLVEELNDSIYLADWEGEMGSWKRYGLRYEEAMRHFLKQISYLEDSDDYERKGFAYLNFGLVMSDMRRYSISILYNKKAIDLFLKNNYGYYVPTVYYNIANSFLATGIADSARVYYLLSLKVAEDYKDEISITDAYLGLANISMRKKDYASTLSKETERNLHIALSIATKYNLTDRQGSVNLLLGKSASQTKKYHNAIRFLKKALLLARSFNDRILVSEVLDLLSAVYTETKQYKEANLLLREVLLYNDSLYQEDIMRTTAELEAKYQNEHKQSEIEKLNADQKLTLLAYQNQIQFYVIIFTSIVVGIIISWMIYYYQTRRRIQLKEKELQELNYRVAETRQIALRAQMNPHFIFNCMAAADHYILNNERTVASSLLTSFADLVRRVLEQSASEMISIQEEFESLELYLKVEQIRFHNSFTYTIDVDEFIDFDVPPLLLQPYVENALVHGITNLKGEGKIEIAATSVSDGMVNITIRDNGVGMKQSSLINKQNKPTHQSMGTRITKERMDLLSLLHGIEINVTINDLSDRNSALSGTEILISLEKSSILC